MLFSFSSSKTPAGTFNLLCIFSSVTFSLALFTFTVFFSHCPFSSFHLHLFSLRVPCDSVLISDKVLSFFIPLHFWVLLSLILFYPSFILFTSGLTFPFAEQLYQPEKTQTLNYWWCLMFHCSYVRPCLLLSVSVHLVIWVPGFSSSSVSSVLLCSFCYESLLGVGGGDWHVIFSFISQGFSFLLLFKDLFIYFWLCWVFVAVLRLSLVVASGGCSPRWATGSGAHRLSSCGSWAQ